MNTTQTNDPVSKPAHYTNGKIEVIEYIEDQEFGFHEANVIKYVSRARHKGKEIEDLKKARWYLDRKIKNLEEAISPAVSQSPIHSRNLTVMAMSATTLHAGNPGYMDWLKVNKPAEYIRLRDRHPETAQVSGPALKSLDSHGFYEVV